MCTGCKRQFVIYVMYMRMLYVCVCVCEVILFSCDVRLGGSNVNASIYLSIHPTIHLSIYLSVCLSIHLFMHSSIHLFIYLAIKLSIYPFLFLSTYLTICQSIYLSFYLSSAKAPACHAKATGRAAGTKEHRRGTGAYIRPLCSAPSPAPATQKPQRRRRPRDVRGTPEGRQGVHVCVSEMCVSVWCVIGMCDVCVV